MNFTAGVRGGSIKDVSNDRRGEEEIRDGVGCFMKVRFLLGLISWDEDRIRAISSSARPRLIFGRLGSSLGSFGSGHGRVAEESIDEK